MKSVDVDDDEFRHVPRALTVVNWANKISFGYCLQF